VEITEAQFQRIESELPRQRGNVRVANLQFLNALLYVAEQGMQVARLAQAFRALAHHLHTHEPLVQERRSGPGFRALAERTDHPHQD